MVWCPDQDHKTGACFKNDNHIELRVKARGNGDYNKCSNHFSNYKSMKYTSCPVKNYCDDKKQSNIYTASKKKTSIKSLNNGIGKLGMCWYQVQFPQSAKKGD